MAQPSIYSGDFCRILQERLDENKQDHPLLVLDPLFREIEFVANNSLRAEYKSKAEELTRKLLRNRKERLRTNSLGDDVLDVDEMGPEDVSSEIDASLPNSDSSHRVGGQKRTFDIFKYTDTVFKELQTLDKVSKYNMLGLDHLPQGRHKFQRMTFQ